jgi:hypothetical protein
VNVGVWVVVVGGGVVVVVVVVVVVGGLLVVVDGGVVVVVVGGEVVVVVVVVVGGEVVVVIVVGGLLVMVVDVVAFEHPMIEVIKTRLTATRRKLEYLIFINNLFLYLEFVFYAKPTIRILTLTETTIGYQCQSPP